jgi:hypothetical protein
LKVSVSDAVCDPYNPDPKISVVQYVSSLAVPSPVKRSSSLVVRSRVLINLRSQADPKILEEDVRAAVEEVIQPRDLTAQAIRMDSFAPGAPNPPYQRR